MDTIITKMPLPRVVCDVCGGTCIYRKQEDTPDNAAWLECTRCHKKWPNVGAGIQSQDAFIDSATDTIKDVTNSAREARRFSQLPWTLMILAGIALGAVAGWGWRASGFAKWNVALLILCSFLLLWHGTKEIGRKP